MQKTTVIAYGLEEREFWRDYEIANNFGADFLSLIM
jgi:hypothetical protein